MKFEDFTNIDEKDDFAFREKLWDRLQADQDGYETNRDFGLYCCSRRKFIFHAEPYLMKALALCQVDEDRLNLMNNLGRVFRSHGNYERARAIYLELCQSIPGALNFLFDLGDVEFYLGNMAESSVWYGRGLQFMENNADVAAAGAGGRDRRILFPSQALFGHIGEIAHKLDLFVKSRRLGLVGDFEPIVLAPKDNVANQTLMDCYRGEVTIISDPAEVDDLSDDDEAPRHFVDYLTLPSGQVLHRELAYGVVQRMWSDRGWGSPIRVPDDTVERGRKALRKYGFAEGDWFAALHVREPGFYDEDQPWNHNRYRNARIADYFPAIEAITRRGGWVLRMGDPSMEPLPAMERVIDYATGPDRHDWMDVFGLSQCRFFVGTASGPMNVARAFSVPVVATNYFPAGTWPFSEGDLFIHKLHRSSGDGRWLGLSEVMKPPVFASWNPMVYERHGIEVVDNSPEDILAVVEEMLDKLEGNSVSNEDAISQKSYRYLADPYKLGFLLPISPAFVKRHPQLLE